MRFAYLLGLLIGLATPAFAGDDLVAAELIQCAPATYEQALECLEKSLPPRGKAELAKPEGSIAQHMGLGMWMRNNWGLWKRGALYEDMRSRGFTHPDDMSGAILDGFSARARGEPFDLEAKAREYAAYWENLKKRTPLPLSECADDTTPLETIVSCERDGNGIVHVNDTIEKM